MKVLFVIFLLIVSSFCWGQDVVFKCNREYYTVKSSAWPTAFNSVKYEKHLNQGRFYLTQLPFNRSVRDLVIEVKRVTGRYYSKFSLKGLLISKDTTDNVAVIMRYRYKITPHYYLPIEIKFNKNGERIFNKGLWAIVERDGIKVNYCDAINKALNDSVFYEFTKQVRRTNEIYGQTLGNVCHLRLRYDRIYQWVWLIYSASNENSDDSYSTQGKIAVIKARDGQKVRVVDYKQFTDQSIKFSLP